MGLRLRMRQAMTWRQRWARRTCEGLRQRTLLVLELGRRSGAVERDLINL